MAVKFTKNFLFLAFMTVFTAFVAVQGAASEREGEPYPKRMRRATAESHMSSSASGMDLDAQETTGGEGVEGGVRHSSSTSAIPPTPTPPDGGLVPLPAAPLAFLSAAVSPLLGDVAPPLLPAPAVSSTGAALAPTVVVDEDAGPFTDPRFDTSFKHMLGIEEEEEDKASGAAAPAQPARIRGGEYRILSSFISAFVGREVRIARTLSPYIPPLRVGSQTQQIMDVACEDTRGARYNIEVQRAFQSFWDKRAVYYMSSLYETKISTAEYTALRPVIGISILDFEREDFTMGSKRHYKMADIKTFPVDMPVAPAAAPSASASVGSAAPVVPIHTLDLFELVEVSLPMVDLGTTPESIEKQWLILLKTAREAARIPDTITDPIVRQAWRRLRLATFGGTARDRYQKEQREFEEEQARIQAAVQVASVRERAAGREEERVAIARSMIERETFTDDLIANLTHLEVEQVTALRGK